ncbi:proton-conducting transporter transmembrane domain-containing protein [Rhodoligotrophos ferricapiens]|uniref:proton-conducting transporter transmembrane domain-containing protein n=1 Tax=Rhodoligotrophos ferricapiens TaxID=3069264 RepID=UPI00315DD4B5
MNQAALSPVTWLAILPAILPLAAGALAIALRGRLAMQRWFALLVLLLELALNIALLVHVRDHGIMSLTMGNWLPPFGISFTADMLGAVLALAATFVSLACCLYAFADIDEVATRFGFYPMLLVLVGGMNGAFLTGDIFNLYVWLEILLISSFGLIILGGTRLQLDGAVKYAFLNLVATTLFLIATGLLYGAVGTLNFADLVAKAANYPHQNLLTVIAALYLVALAMKAAAFPLFFWLPASYHTPKFVASALFAALLTKVGVYGIYRIFTAVFAGGMGFVPLTLTWAAGLTMLLGAAGAVAQHRMRPMLGFLVVAGIGYMLLGFSLGTENARAAGTFYMVQSMLVMAGLYLLSGLVHGARKTVPTSGSSASLYDDQIALAILFLVLGFAVAGLPPFSGFWPKFALVRESLAQHLGWAAAAVLISGFLTTIAIARSFAATFWGASHLSEDGEQPGPQTSFATLTPILAIAALVLVFGLLPGTLYGLADGAARGIADYGPYVAAVLGAGP